MKRHHAHRTAQRPAVVPASPRRAGIPSLTIAAVAAACVLAACGPEEVTASAVIPTAEPTLVSTAASTPVPANAMPGIIRVADRGDYVPQRDRAADYRSDYRDGQYAQQQVTRPQYGQVTSIEPITQPTKQGPGAGTVVGGVLGAVVGNQIGSGNGRAAATVLGGVGGAVVGNKIEKKRSEQVVGYRVHVQLDNGTTQSFERQQLSGIDVGDRVRVDGGRLREV